MVPDLVMLVLIATYTCLAVFDTISTWSIERKSRGIASLVEDDDEIRWAHAWWVQSESFGSKSAIDHKHSMYVNWWQDKILVIITLICLSNSTCANDA